MLRLGASLPLTPSPSSILQSPTTSPAVNPSLTLISVGGVGGVGGWWMMMLLFIGTETLVTQLVLMSLVMSWTIQHISESFQKRRHTYRGIRMYWLTRLLEVCWSILGLWEVVLRAGTHIPRLVGHCCRWSRNSFRRPVSSRTLKTPV